MPGLDPGIHRSLQESAFGGWIAGDQARRRRFAPFARQ